MVDQALERESHTPCFGSCSRGSSHLVWDLTSDFVSGGLNPFSDHVTFRGHTPVWNLFQNFVPEVHHTSFRTLFVSRGSGDQHPVSDLWTSFPSGVDQAPDVCIWTSFPSGVDQSPDACIWTSFPSLPRLIKPRICIYLLTCTPYSTYHTYTHFFTYLSNILLSFIYKHILTRVYRNTHLMHTFLCLTVLRRGH